MFVAPIHTMNIPDPNALHDFWYSQKAHDAKLERAHSSLDPLKAEYINSVMCPDGKFREYSSAVFAGQPHGLHFGDEVLVCADVPFINIKSVRI